MGFSSEKLTRVLIQGSQAPTANQRPSPGELVLYYDTDTNILSAIDTNGNDLIVGAGQAPINSPAFTGVPTAPTAAPGTNTLQLATTAFVGAAVLVETNRAEAAEALLAPKASPTFTGIPAAPTAAPGTNTTQIATTAYVIAAGTASLSSPTFIGTPAAPTATPGTNTTQLATTAFVTAAVAAVTSTPLYDKAGNPAAAGNAHIASGTATLVAGTVTVTLSGASIFSSTSYVVMSIFSGLPAGAVDASNDLTVNILSGSSFTIASSDTADVSVLMWTAIGF